MAQIDEKDIAALNKVPPHDEGAEQALLSCMIFDEEGIRPAIEKLTAEDFYNPRNRVIYQAICDLYERRVPVDLVTLKNKLEELEAFEKVGGMEYIVKLGGLVSTSVRVRHYVKIVAEKAILRRLIKVSGEISESSYSGSNAVDEIINMAERGIFNIAQNRKSEDFAPIQQVLVNTIERIEQAFNSGNQAVTGISTGFIEFDKKTAGFQKSDLILIAARPSMGKTAFALNIAQYAAVEKKVPVALFSLEMSKEQVVNRMLCAQARVDAQRVRTGDLENDDWDRIGYAMGALSEAPIFIDDTSGVSPSEVRAKCRKLKLEHGLGMIVIDYLQLMRGSGLRRNDSVQQEVAEISKSLKAIARELDVPVVALSQLSRANEKRTDHRPMLSDLRDSGAIEQDADLVCFLYRDEYYHPDKEENKNIAEVIIAKQRNGPVGTIKLMWMGKYTKFENLAKESFPS